MKIPVKQPTSTLKTGHHLEGNLISYLFVSQPEKEGVMEAIREQIVGCMNFEKF